MKKTHRNRQVYRLKEGTPSPYDRKSLQQAFGVNILNTPNKLAEIGAAEVSILPFIGTSALILIAKTLYKQGHTKDWKRWLKGNEECRVGPANPKK